MRIAAASLLALIALTGPAVASGCFWVGGRIYCDGGCRVTERWWDGYQEWMRYSCSPPPELVLAGAIFLFGLLAVIGAVAAASASSSTPGDKEIAEADAQAEEAQRITDRLKAAAKDADRFLETYKR